ncbi:RHS repeat-associated core domain [Paraburkholderia caribensis MBA4]|uniref:RHS repeat-associated core domain n=1 Tax=Paraburkholderia caribensis MBA4 TaxID=1323664 RepID=A0A0P0R9H0_9BURK|nr:RHS repeat-associated core domain-containing protein [Paraburkholderia caribensis]ALL65001.1 RHS repeat-associated core domain [Paraburkholderia caribensis MBA4]
MDGAGQLVKRQNCTAGVQRLEWDEFGRLACFENTHNECWRYQYDALGRRVGKAAAEVRRQVEGVRHGKHGARTWFLWDGDVFAGELRRGPDQAGVAADAGRFYVYHPDSFEPLAMQVVGQSGDAGMAAAEVGLYYYQNDPNGAPVRLRTGDGRIVWEAHYGVTGAVDHVETCLIDQPVRLQGQYFDGESGLYYNRHRYFDPATGIFISQDPIGLDGGVNSYEFASNVFGWIDPLGLIKESKAGRYHGPKPKYENPGHHDPSSGNFRGGGTGKTSILPSNAEGLYKHAVPDAEGKHWYALDQSGVVHRYGNSNNGHVHWNGDTSQGRGIPIPPEVKKRIDQMKKDGIPCPAKRKKQ